MSKFQKNKKSVESKPKKATKETQSDSPFTDDRYFCLNEKQHRFVSLSEFKGTEYLNIREYYEDNNGDLKPGKKGISLKKEEFDLIVKHLKEIKQWFGEESEENEEENNENVSEEQKEKKESEDDE